MSDLRASIKAHFDRHPLDPDQLRALRSIQHGNKARHVEELAAHGYVRHGLGGVMLTDLGRLRLLHRV